MIISIIALLFSFFVIYHKNMMKLRKDIDSLNERITREISTVKEMVIVLDSEIKPVLEAFDDFQKGIISQTMKKILPSSNPLPEEKVKDLFNKLEKGELNLEETNELKTLLDNELEKARKKKDFSLISNLTILIAILESRMERLTKT